MKTLFRGLLAAALMGTLMPAATAQSLPPHPRLLLDATDVQALKARITQSPWDKQWANFKASVEKTMGSRLELPPRGGNWSHNYVCPQHGTRLKKGKQVTAWQWEHICPIGPHTLRGRTTKANLDFDGNGISDAHNSFARQTIHLGVIYQVTGEARYAERAREILLAYTDKYLSYALHDNQGQPRKGGRVASQSLTEASWLINMAQGADLIWNTLNTKQRHAAEEKLFRPALEQIILPAKLGIHNIQCRHNAAIGLVGFLLNDEKLIKIAIDDPVRGFRTQIRKGVQDDGMWLEGASGYHFFTIEGLWPLSEAARHSGINLYNARFKSMFDAPLILAMPNLTLPNFNDSGFVGLESRSDLYELAFSRWKDPRYVPLVSAGKRKSDLALWYGTAQLPAGTVDAAQGSRNSPASGYTILEKGAGENATWLCVKYGPHGGGHGHNDKNHFILYARGEVLMPDGGTHAYGSPLHSTWDKTTLAHNTLVVDEQSQSPTEGRTLAFGSSGGVDYSVTDAGKIYPGVRFVRSVALLNENLVVIVDQVSAEQEHQFDIVAHFTGRWQNVEGEEWMPPDAPGYKHMASGSKRRSAVGWRGVVQQENGATDITLAGGEATKIITGTGIGASTKDLVPMVLLRRTARETAFVWAVTLDGKPATLETLTVTAGGQPLSSSIATAVSVRSGGKSWTLMVNPEKQNATVLLPGGPWNSREVFVAREAGR